MLFFAFVKLILCELTFFVKKGSGVLFVVFGHYDAINQDVTIMFRNHNYE